MDKGLISDLLKTPSQIRKENDQRRLTEGLAMAQLAQQGNTLGGVGGMFANFGAQQAAQTGRNISNAFRGVTDAIGTVTGADLRPADERAAGQAQALARSIDMKDPASIRAGADKMRQFNPKAAEALELRAEKAQEALTAQQEKEEQALLKEQQQQAAYNYLKDKNPNLAAAVLKGLDFGDALTAMKNEAPISVGDSLVTTDGDVLFTTPRKPNTTYSILTKDEAKELGLPANGTYQKDSNTGKISAVGGNVRDISVGTIPKDHRLVTSVDSEGNETLSMQVIENSPTALQMQREQAAVLAGARNTGNVADTVTSSIETALKIIDESSVATGVTGALVSMAGPFKAGSSRADLENKVETIKANIGFDRLQQMREQSPTGGALGQVAVKELEALQAVLGSLNLNQSKEQLKGNLQNIMMLYRQRAKQVANIYSSEELQRYGLGHLISYRTVDPLTGEMLKAEAEEGFDFEALSQEDKDLWEFYTDEEKRQLGAK